MCRVGITTDPERRKAEWERHYPSMYGWRILATYPTKEAAQAHEDGVRFKKGCVGSPGGDDAPGDWSVYQFQYSAEFQYSTER